MRNVVHRAVQVRGSECGKAVVLGMNAGRVNAINHTFLEDLDAALTEIETDALYADRPVIVASASPIAFSAGLDLKHVSSLDRRQFHDFMTRFEEVFMRLLTLPRRTVAAINGHALAGGYFVGLACDERVALEGDYRIGANEVLVGLEFPAVCYAMAQPKLSPHVLYETFSTGKSYTVNECLQNGYLRAVFPKNDAQSLLQRATLLATSEMPPEATRAFVMTKQRLLEPFVEEWRAKREALLQRFVETRFSPGSQKLLQSAVEKLSGGAKTNTNNKKENAKL
ncbi:Short chain enoyl-CoA hydratase [Balamuthia mandrillaris]